MKLQGISVGDRHPTDSRSLQEFVEGGGEHVTSGLGKCLVALVAEDIWSREYGVSGSFGGNDPYLRVDHPAFLTDQPLVLYASQRVWTVREVEIAVRKHLQTSKSWTRSVMALAQNQAHLMQMALEAIPLAKAKAAIVQVFPEAAGACHFHTDGSFHAFMLGNNINQGCTYVVREVDGTFTGGVAKINRSANVWYSKKSGLASVADRAATFFGQLALSFVAEQLQIPEDELRVVNWVGVERPIAECPGVDQYSMESVVLSRCDQTDSSSILVGFDNNNMPFVATIQPPAEG